MTIRAPGTLRRVSIISRKSSMSVYRAASSSHAPASVIP